MTTHTLTTTQCPDWCTTDHAALEERAHAGFERSVSMGWKGPIDDEDLAQDLNYYRNLHEIEQLADGLYLSIVTAEPKQGPMISVEVTDVDLTADQARSIAGALLEAADRLDMIRATA